VDAAIDFEGEAEEHYKFFHILLVKYYRDSPDSSEEDMKSTSQCEK
jgi:hypothetical protein